VTTLGSILRAANSDLVEQIELAEDQKDVTDVLDLLRINPTRFFENIELLMARGNPLLLMRFGSGENGTRPTPSAALKKILPIHERPGKTPLWAMAAFPDVLDWFCEKQEEARRNGKEDLLIWLFAEISG
jgi:hypothetical protein